MNGLECGGRHVCAVERRFEREKVMGDIGDNIWGRVMEID